ncbi:hypothetical protein MBAV_002480 [Candidatus Magnetobacterium bavaricum]|uniref:Uncharacterized protein n=1 Tax=Candidatus Magnetobacterium bavaricum TaxID=29290 RepID=A0A0F3GTQ0_9BACT|nr:hypothetical protein MBAV_002480 [Candidatus Magnetobacterium bavaricum]
MSDLLKDSTIIRFRPIRHWTDSKICAYAFCKDFHMAIALEIGLMFFYAIATLPTNPQPVNQPFTESRGLLCGVGEAGWSP